MSKIQLINKNHDFQFEFIRRNNVITAVAETPSISCFLNVYQLTKTRDERCVNQKIKKQPSVCLKYLKFDFPSIQNTWNPTYCENRAIANLHRVLVL